MLTLAAESPVGYNRTAHLETPTMPLDAFPPSRRQVLGATTGLVAGAALAKDVPGVRPAAAPRATSGDRADPDWKERLTLSVGPKKADLVGTTEKVIQAAVDLVT